APADKRLVARPDEGADLVGREVPADLPRRGGPVLAPYRGRLGPLALAADPVPPRRQPPAGGGEGLLGGAGLAPIGEEPPDVLALHALGVTRVTPLEQPFDEIAGGALVRLDGALCFPGGVQGEQPRVEHTRQGGAAWVGDRRPA